MMTNSPPVQIVIIEDEKQIRHFLYSALTADGFQVYEAENGQRGLIDCATRKPDLVILDLGLPDIYPFNLKVLSVHLEKYL